LSFRLFIICLLAVWLSSCKDESSFAGGGNKEDKNANDPNSSNDDDDDDDDGSQKACSEHGDTVAELITKSIRNGQPDNFIAYDIRIENYCEDSPKTVKSISFDVNSIVSKRDTDRPLDYRILYKGQDLANGVLENVQGSDLFGNIGEKYFHNRTDQTISFEAASEGVRLRIELNGIFYMQPTTINQPVPQNKVTLETYLRFGDAKVVTKNATFVGEPPSEVIDALNSQIPMNLDSTH
jgi:hypothetical protein